MTGVLGFGFGPGHGHERFGKMGKETRIPFTSDQSSSSQFWLADETREVD